MLYVGRNIIQTLASYPVGYLADKLGHKRILTLGYFIGVITAILIALAFVFHTTSILYLGAVFFMAGLYIAIQDALEATTTADYVPQQLRGTGYGLLGSVNGGGDLISSSVVGILWTTISPVIGFGFAAMVMAIGQL